MLDIHAYIQLIAVEVAYIAIKELAHMVQLLNLLHRHQTMCQMQIATYMMDLAINCLIVAILVTFFGITMVVSSHVTVHPLKCP
jgi:uncharacterized membrane protein